MNLDQRMRLAQKVLTHIVATHYGTKRDVIIELDGRNFTYDYQSRTAVTEPAAATVFWLDAEIMVASLTKHLPNEGESRRAYFWRVTKNIPYSKIVINPFYTDQLDRIIQARS